MEFDLYELFEYREKLLKELKIKYDNGELTDEDYKNRKEYIEIYY